MNNVEAVLAPRIATWNGIGREDLLRIARAPMLTDDERMAFATDYIAGDRDAARKCAVVSINRNASAKAIAIRYVRACGPVTEHGIAVELAEQCVGVTMENAPSVAARIVRMGLGDWLAEYDGNEGEYVMAR